MSLCARALMAPPYKAVPGHIAFFPNGFRFVCIADSMHRTLCIWLSKIDLIAYDAKIHFGRKNTKKPDPVRDKGRTRKDDGKKWETLWTAEIVLRRF